MADGDFANHFAHKLIDAAMASGFDFKTICQASGIAPRSLENAVFEPQELARLSRHVKLLMQDEFCGLTRSRCKIGAFEMMCDIVTSGTTLGDALEKGFRLYGLLSSDITFTVTTQENVAMVQVDIAHPELDSRHFLTEWWLLVWWAVSSWLIGETMKCRTFAFPHRAEIAVEEYERVFSAPCQFGQTSARMIFGRQYLDKPVVKALGNLSEMLLVPRLEFGVVPGVHHNLGIRLASHLRSRFQACADLPSMEDVARQFNLSSQTLRRRLEEEGLHYRSIKDDVRREVALKLLQDKSITLVEVARRCGFSEASALARAVKGWTGMYPKEYRAQLDRLH